MIDFPLGETIDFKFSTRAFATGVPTTLAGSPVIDIYEDNDTTEITGAETLSVDFDGIAGFHNLRIVATGGNGFESGKSYAAVISTGTVGGVSVVGETVAQFTIERTAALMPTTAGRTLDILATGEAAANLTHIMDVILTEGGAGQLSAAFIKLFDVAVPLLVADEVMRGTDGANTTVPDAAGVAGTAVELAKVPKSDSNVSWNATALAAILAEVTASIVAHNLDHLCLTATAGADMTTEVADNTIFSRMLANGDTSAFAPSTDGLQPIRDRGDAEWVTATSVTVSDKTGFSLSTAGINAIWDIASALTLDFGTLLERTYQLLNNEMNVTNATGAVALRNLADNADIATGSITDGGVTTSRAAYAWV